MEKSWSRQQFEAEMKANPRRKANKTFGEFRGIPIGSEDEIQAYFFRWIDLHKKTYPILRLFFAIPNGTHTTKTVRGILSVTGRRPGVPDTFLPFPAEDGSGKIGLWIEFKSKTGTVSPEQKQWIKDLQAIGYRVELCRSWTDAANITIDYLNLPLEKL